MRFTLLYIFTLIFFTLVDLLWLGIIAKNIYSKRLKKLASTKPNWYYAGAFYMTYTLGIIIFAVYPAIFFGLPMMSLLGGVFFGFFNYATYQLTNAAVIKNWPNNLIVVDIIWGSILTGLTSYISFLIFQLF